MTQKILLSIVGIVGIIPFDVPIGVCTVIRSLVEIAFDAVGKTIVVPTVLHVVVIPTIRAPIIVHGITIHTTIICDRVIIIPVAVPIIVHIVVVTVVVIVHTIRSHVIIHIVVVVIIAIAIVIAIVTVAVAVAGAATAEHIAVVIRVRIGSGHPVEHFRRALHVVRIVLRCHRTKVSTLILDKLFRRNPYLALHLLACHGVRSRRSRSRGGTTPRVGIAKGRRFILRTVS